MMKYLAIVLLGFMSFAPVTHAAEPLFGFMDGKVYDSTATLKYMCFLDNKCYDLNGVFSFARTPVAVAPVDSSDDFMEDCYEPLDEFRIEMAELEAEYQEKYQRIISNAGGTWGNAIAHEVQQLDQRYAPLRQSIQNERNEFAQEHCAEYANRALPGLY